MSTVEEDVVEKQDGASHSQEGGSFVNLHIGMGSFHRAHQAVYMQRLHTNGDVAWVLASGNIRPDMIATEDALRAQGGTYTLETISPQGEHEYESIHSIKQVIPWDAELAGLTAVAVDPRTRIISFTVTEAGYYLDSDDNIDPDSYPDLASDIRGDTVCTLYGTLEKLMQARKDAGAGGITLMCCDNLRHNGSRFSGGFQQFLARRQKAALLAWVRDNTTTPNTMVDRITPRPTKEVVQRVKEARGIDDPAAVMGETFIDWVIEDNFIAGRPAWETVGVKVVQDVGPYEEAKIRVLNATHSCIAWAATLAGLRCIHEGAQDSEIRAFGYNYVTDNVIPALPGCPLNLESYRDTVLDRFSNPHIEDTNARVAMDSYSKIPGFILPTIRENLANNTPLDSVATVLALFLAFLQRQQRGDIDFVYKDQQMDPESARSIVSSDDPVKAFVGERLLFQELAGNGTLLTAMRAAFDNVQDFVSHRST